MIAFDEVLEVLEDARAQLIASPPRALELASAALAASEAHADLVGEASARQVRGDALRFLGQHEAALDEYARASDLFRRGARPIDAARADACTVDSLRCLGRISDALRLASRTRRTFKRLGEDLRSAVVDEIVGLVYMQQNDYTRALRMFDRARPTIAEVGRPIDLAALNNNAATTLTNLDRLREAQTLYAAARAVYAEHRTDAAVARVDVNLGYLAFRQGRFGAAVDLLREAADVFDSLRNAPLAIATRLDLTETYLALNLLDEAGALSQEQLAEAERFSPDLDNEHARGLFYLATQRGRLRRADEALDGLVQAEAEFAASNNPLWQARCAAARAVLLLEPGDSAGRGDVREAVRLARRAANVFGRLGSPSRQAATGALLARALLRASRLPAAEQEARLALSLAQRVGVPWLLFECQYTLGRVLREAGQAEPAYAAYLAAADALERVRAELQPEELRMSLVSDKTQLYEELVLLSLARQTAEAACEALEHAERAKSRTFAEHLAASLATPTEAIDAEFVGPTDAGTLERMRELRDDLVWLYSKLSDASTSSAESLARVRQQVASREAELVRLQRRLQPASRGQAKRLGIAAPVAETATVLDRLGRRQPAESVVLEYFAVGNELLVFGIRSGRVIVHRLGLLDGVVDLVDRFRFQISKFSLGDEYVQAHANVLRQQTDALLSDLYSRLIGPCEDQLVGAKRVIVVPHAALHYLPFHALLDPSGAPLIERVELSYAPSAMVLAACLERPAARAGTAGALLVGVPDPAIPHLAAEIEALRGIVDAPTVLTAEAATERAFREHAPDASLIHLASHAVFRHDNPLFSAIRLADGWLSLYDLSALRLRAALVTLSACETGVNDVLAGDELVGLARGFFQAGAASVVVSLWVVSDASTARLMQRFYHHLRCPEGASVPRPAQAMRAAQLELRHTGLHPYYWAPFMVIGRP